jgi:hypothetical protein
VSESNHFDGQRPVATPSNPSHLRLPRMTQQDNIIAAVPRKVYSNAHAYHIHSISVNSDQETYISADDLRINLWNLNTSDQSFSKSYSPSAHARYPALTRMTNSPHFASRYRRHQTRKYGGINRSHHCHRIPPVAMQPFHVLELKKQYQTR